MYPFIIVLFYFQISGMCPISLNFNKSNKNGSFFGNIFVFWSVINIAAIVCFAIFCMVRNEELFLQHSTIGRFNDLLKFVTIILTHFVLLTESLWTRDHQMNIWQKFQLVDQFLLKIDVDVNERNRKFYQNFSVKFFICFGLATVIELFIVTSIQDDDQYQMYWFLTFVSLLMSRSRHLQQNLYIDMLAFRFYTIKQELKRMVAQSKKSDFSHKEEINSKKLLCKVKRIKEIYNMQWEISVHVNKSFGMSQLTNLMQNFIQLTSDLYWIYSVLYKNNFTNIGILVLGLIPTFSILTILLFSCEKCLREVRLIGFLIHNIEKDIDNYEFDVLIESFSLQIIQEPFFFSVVGFFNMDFSLLKAMVAAITTYMVIFIQFMPKDEAVVTGNVTNITSTTTMPLVQTIITNSTSV